MLLRRLFLLVCLSILTVSASAKTVPAKPYKVMMILYRGSTDAEKGFVAYFKRHHIDVDFIVRDAQADNSKIAGFVAEARALRPDLIYTFGTTVTAEVAGLVGAVDPARHITDIPIVFDIVADPVGAKLVKSLKGSGRNLTGASHLVPLAAQMKALQAMRPTQTLGVVYNPMEKNSTLAVQELDGTAASLGLTVVAVPVVLDSVGKPTPEGVVAAMQTLVAKKPQFIYIPSDSFLIKNADMVVRAAGRAQIPVFAATEAPIRNDGALLGLVSNYFNVGELAAYKAEQILSKKLAPADVPIETLNRFTYLVNMGAAKSLGVYPPLSVVKVAELLAPLSTVDGRE